jgi:ribonuclease G
MSKELVIGSGRHETKVAILEDDQLVEIYFQRANEYSLAGSIHKGKVTRVLPGMQSAFVDLGLERDTFLYVSDFFEEHPDIDTVSEEKSPRGPKPEQRRERSGDRERERIAAPEQNRGSVSTEEPVVSSSASQSVPAGVAAFSAAPAEAPAEEPGSGNDPASRDQRMRRSRRRRSRGRGFPENKYAQPPGAARETAEPSESEEEEGVDEPAKDVIILPGESLAKYRHVATPPAEQDAVSAEPTPAISTGDEETGEPSAELHSALADYPEPLAEAPPTAAHQHEVATAQETSETSAETVAESPEPATQASGAEETPEEESELRYDNFSIHLTSDLDEAEVTAAEVREEQLAELAQAQAESEIDNEVESETEEEPSLVEIDEFEIDLVPEQPEAGMTTTLLLIDTDEAAEETAEAAEGADLEDLPELTSEPILGSEAAMEAAAQAAPESLQKENTGAAQTAAVREQGGRYPHRVSRRMRRRRGGRPNQQNNGEANAKETANAVQPAPAEPREDRESKPEREEREFKSERAPLPSITDLLKAGQEIIVQIAKEPLGQKGARITSHIALPGRYVVYMPSVEHLGVSRKIASEEERHRLKKILQAHRAGASGGFIVRTAGEGHSEEEIAADMNFLYNLWLDIRQKAEKKPAPALLHHDLDIVQRILRDQVTDEFKAVWVDNEEMYESILRFVQRFQPALVGRVKLYTRKAPIFDAFNLTQELEKALRPKVWLKSGGYIVINQTEALVAIDVNTGKFVGKSNRLEDTIVKTNTEAVKEIVRQVRLRDLGGIIVVDFIDMDERKNRQKVMQALEEAMRSDKAPYKILQFNDFGLVAITRKRVKQSLERTLCSPCPYCEGAGYVKSVQTVIGEILIEAQKIAPALEGNDVVLRCNPDVARSLKSKDNQYLEELEEVLGRPVLVTGDPQIHLEKFDLA